MKHSCHFSVWHNHGVFVPSSSSRHVEQRYVVFFEQIIQMTLKPLVSHCSILLTVTALCWCLTGFQSNMTTNEGSWFDLEPSACDKKGVPRGNPRFHPSPYHSQCPSYLGALPTLFHTPTTQIYFCHTPLGEHLTY